MSLYLVELEQVETLDARKANNMMLSHGGDMKKTMDGFANLMSARDAEERSFRIEVESQHQAATAQLREMHAMLVATQQRAQLDSQRCAFQQQQTMQQAYQQFEPAASHVP